MEQVVKAAAEERAHQAGIEEGKSIFAAEIIKAYDQKEVWSIESSTTRSVMRVRVVADGQPAEAAAAEATAHQAGIEEGKRILANEISKDHNQKEVLGLASGGVSARPGTRAHRGRRRRASPSDAFTGRLQKQGSG